MSLTVRDRGAAMVEFAIILPILLLLLLGMVEFGRAYNAQITLNQATREGARILAISQGDAAQAEGATRNVAMTTLDNSKLSVSTTACDPGNPTSVTAAYPFTYEIPFFGVATMTLSSTGVMRCGG